MNQEELGMERFTIAPQLRSESTVQDAAESEQNEEVINEDLW